MKPPTFKIYSDDAATPAAILVIEPETDRPLVSTAEYGEIAVAFVDPQLERILEMLLHSLPGLRHRSFLRDVGPSRPWGVSSCNEVAYALSKLPPNWKVIPSNLPPHAVEDEVPGVRY